MQREALVDRWRWLVRYRSCRLFYTLRRQAYLRVDPRRWFIGVSTDRCDDFSGRGHARLTYVSFGPMHLSFWKKVG